MPDPTWRALAELAVSQHGVFTTKQAERHGVSCKRLRAALARGQLRQLARGVYVFAAIGIGQRQLLMAADLLGATASHGSAAHLHRLDGFEDPDQVDVSVAHGRRLVLPGATVHHWRYDSRHDITSVDGIRCTSIARTLVQLGAVAEPDEVERALDSALRRGVSLDWIVWTLERLKRPGVTGVCVLEDILADPERIVRVDSPLERDLADALRAAGLPMPVAQFEIATPLGTFRADFAYPQQRVLIEAHSMEFHGGDGPTDRDMRRHLALVAQGYDVVYLTAAMLADPQKWLPLVRAALERASHHQD